MKKALDTSCEASAGFVSDIMEPATSEQREESTQQLGNIWQHSKQQEPPCTAPRLWRTVQPHR